MGERVLRGGDGHQPVPVRLRGDPAEAVSPGLTNRHLSWPITVDRHGQAIRSLDEAHGFQAQQLAGLWPETEAAHQDGGFPRDG